MNKPFIALRPEITRTHAHRLMYWLEDEHVTQHLSDRSSVARLIKHAIERTQLPILTPLFNQGGRFFMAHDRRDEPVGFVRLIKTGRECEIVLVIGDRDNWGRRLGTSTILEALKLAFFEMRAEKVIAKIHPENDRSIRAFERCGFSVEAKAPTLVRLVLNEGRYRRLLREGELALAPEIFITEVDRRRLLDLICWQDGAAIVDLEHEIERAIVVEPEAVAPHVITLNSRVLLNFDGEAREVTLVYHDDANEPAGRYSVLSDLGAAILGHKEGDVIDWVLDDRPRRVVIERVLYQPEAAGDFTL